METLKTKLKIPLLILAVIAICSGVLMQTGCKFLEAAQESAAVVREDLDGINVRVAEVLEKFGAEKVRHDAAIAELEAAQAAGELDKAEVLKKQIEIYKSSGVEIWKEYQNSKAEQKQLTSAYKKALVRVDEAETKEEKWGSIFGTLLTGATSLFGLGGVGTAIMSVRNGRQQVRGRQEEADEWREGARVTAKMLESMKEFSPDSWKRIDVGAMMAKTDNSVLAKIDEVRP